MEKRKNWTINVDYFRGVAYGFPVHALHLQPLLWTIWLDVRGPTVHVDNIEDWWRGEDGGVFLGDAGCVILKEELEDEEDDDNS